MPARESSDQMKITLKESKEIKSRAYRLSPGEEKEVRAQIDDRLAKGIIKKSSSEYASPIFVARKKDGRLRVCINYKKLNVVIQRNN